MEKIFSYVELETNTKIKDSGFMSGIPGPEEIKNSLLYRELLEDCGGSKYIKIAVNAFNYGEKENITPISKKEYTFLLANIESK